MMKKNIKYIFAVLILAILYAAFLICTNKLEEEGEKPIITVPDQILSVSVSDDESVLLDGIKANDAEDGDLTSKIIIDNISKFDENKNRTVTYVVFDSDDHMVKATRKIKYRDYQPPKIDLEKPLVFYYVGNNEEFKNFVGASSSLDGDISSNITIDKRYCLDRQCFIDVSVVDSCGTKTSMTLKTDELNTIPTITLELSEYLIYVDKGSEINPKDYIKHIEYMGMDVTGQISKVEIQDNYNASKPGTYEFIYRYTGFAGDYGIAKLVVVVQE